MSAVEVGCDRCGSWAAAKNVGSRFLQLLLPFRNLVGVNIELFSQFRQCLVALVRGNGHLRLVSRCVVPSRPSHALAPLVAVIFTAWVGQGYHLTDCPNWRGHFCKSHI